MKKIIVLMMIIMLIGCASKEITCPDGSKAADYNMCNTEEKIEPVQEKEIVATTEPTKEVKGSDVVSGKLDPKIEEALLKFDTVKSLAFFYNSPKDDKQFDVMIKDDQMKITLGSNRYDSDLIKSYDHVYLDLSSKKAWAVCESTQKCNYEITEVEVPFGDWYVETPYEKVHLIQPDAKILSTSQCDGNKKCMYISSGAYEIGLWDYKGVPIIIENGDYTVSYQNVAYNSVKDSDMEFLNNK